MFKAFLANTKNLKFSGIGDEADCGGAGEGEGLLFWSENIF